MNLLIHIFGALPLAELTFPVERPPESRMGELRATTENALAGTILETIKVRLKANADQTADLKESLKQRNAVIKSLKSEAMQILNESLNTPGNIEDSIWRLAPRIHNLHYQKSECQRLAGALKVLKSEKRAHDRLYGVISNHFWGKQ